MHPDINIPPATVHPCRKFLSEIDDKERDLAELLNKVQRHTKCTEGYCLRRKNGKLQCRFKFPIDLLEESRIIIDEKMEVQYLTARNDPLLNKFNPYIVQSWRANIDISPVLSKRALINYLSKYISKCEPQSKGLADLLKIIIEECGEDVSPKKVVQKMLIRTVSERDYGAQEVCHLLMGGRKVVHLYFQDDDWFEIIGDPRTSRPALPPNVVASVGACLLGMPAAFAHSEAFSKQKGGLKRGKSYLEKYSERNDALKDYWLMKCAKEIDFKSNSWSKNRKDAIVQFHPIYKLKEANHANNEKFYKQQVLLYLTWQNEADLIVDKPSWKEVYEENFDVINVRKLKNHASLEGEVVAASDDDDGNYCPVNEDYFASEEWMNVSRMGPNQNASEVEIGQREMDLAYDWNHALSQYENFGGIPYLKSFLSLQKECHGQSCRNLVSMPDVQFTSEQQVVIDLVKRQLDSFDEISSNVPRRVVVQGPAGTGKSLVIAAITNLIQAKFGQHAVALLCPTGVSAINIQGSTIHSYLNISICNATLDGLSGNALFKLQEKLRNIKFVILDEYSMIGLKMFHAIDMRLRQGKEEPDKVFGNCFMFMFGDIKQLDPVGDKPIYQPLHQNQVCLDLWMGKMAVESFDTTIKLTIIKRQNDQNFQNVLNNISDGNVTLSDYALLSTRFYTTVSNEERRKFENVIRLFPYKKEVAMHNAVTLKNLRDPVTNEPKPVARISAIHNCIIASKGSVDAANGLEPILYLAEGAIIMLRVNLWTEQGLVNGSMGSVVHILYEDGPFLNDIEKTVSISAITKYWTTRAGVSCSRTNFPLSLAYACTIHKSQGLTLEMVFIRIGGKEQGNGITYTAISRARLQNLNGQQYITKRLHWISQLNSLMDPFARFRRNISEKGVRRLPEELVRGQLYVVTKVERKLSDFKSKDGEPIYNMIAHFCDNEIDAIRFSSCSSFEIAVKRSSSSLGLLSSSSPAKKSDLDSSVEDGK
ncbi:ATP-dependent DNA helicase [Frankliniella fusca]|uniref:ATP-dependent DNA helicase n=1 Tax=Frankliniella fusca TaxID=407009 RepID=A0AAE1HS55_9NEOP|nr:ATP-dependent DNA helicase [Frankliniella fusca]